MRIAMMGVVLALSFFVGFAVASERPVLHVYTWEGYISDRVIASFEEKTGALVELDYYDSNEAMVEKMLSGGGYDVITPPGFAVETLRLAGAIREIDHALIPNLNQVHTRAAVLTFDPDMNFSVPYTVTVTGVAYNPALVSEDARGSWAIFADSRLAGKVTLMNDPRETIGAALKYLGYSLNSTDPAELEEAGDMLRRWKRNVALFSVDEARDGLRDGKYAAIQAYHGDFARIHGEKPELRFFIPREGTAFNSDKLAVCADSEAPELAHAFINHLLEPAVAAVNMEDVKYFMPNVGAIEIGGDRVRQHPAVALPAELRDRCEMVKGLSPEESAMYDDVWGEVLMGED